MKYIDVVLRGAEEYIYDVLGSSTIKLINLLNSTMSLRQKNEIIEQIYGVDELLKIKKIRDHIIDLLNENELNDFSKKFAIKAKNSFEIRENLKKISYSEKNLIVLYEAFSIDSQTMAKKEILPAKKIIEAGYPLFDYQVDVLNKCLSALDEKPHRLLLHMPTGAGKTRTAMNIVAEILRKKSDALIIWLAHSKELCEQAASEFEKAWPMVGNKNTKIYRYWENYKLDLKDIQSGFLIASLSKLYNLDAEKRKTLGSKCLLIVFDEAHKAIAESYRFIIESLMFTFDDKQKKMLIGLTATPGRTWKDICEDQRLADFFNRKKIGLEIKGYDNPVDFLIEKKYLAKPIFSFLKYDSKIGIDKNEYKILSKGFDIPESILKKLAANDVRNLAIIKRAIELTKDNKRIIIFSSSVENSEKLAIILRSKGIYANSVTSKTNPQKRKLLIDIFKSSNPKPMILTNYGVLTTGFDAPMISAAIIARPTNSLVLYSQMVGRVIRGEKAGGGKNKIAQIITVIDSN